MIHYVVIFLSVALFCARAHRCWRYAIDDDRVALTFYGAGTLALVWCVVVPGIATVYIVYASLGILEIIVEYIIDYKTPRRSSAIVMAVGISCIVMYSYAPVLPVAVLIAEDVVYEACIRNTVYKKDKRVIA
jgi:hypothetical protein